MKKVVMLLSLVAVLGATCGETVVAEKPNIILIITDDQGYGDLGYHGNPVLETPNLDRLAEESVRFTDFHVDPTCSPTRAALMTGKYSLRAGVWHTIMGRSLLPAGNVTIPEVLRDQGYRTAMFGKWHLGDNYPFRPQDQGFDEVVIHGGGGVGQTPDYWGNTQFDDHYYRNGEPEPFEGYATRVWFDEALEFIRTNREGPFFAYISTNAPHAPWRAPEEYVEAYGDKGLPDFAQSFYAMITYVDGQVGRLREELKTLGLEENTILIFMTDNGTSLRTIGKGKKYSPFNAGMRGIKGSVYDGGHRVPFFVHAPGGDFGEPRDIDQLAAHFDVLPTLADLAGAEEPGGIDGVSLLPVLKGITEATERSLVVTNQRTDIPNFNRKHVLMTDRWRFVVDGSARKEELFDIEADPGQKKDLLSEFPDKADELRHSLREWWSDASSAGHARQRIIVGSDHENPARLTAMDWMKAKGDGAVPWKPGFAWGSDSNPRGGWLSREDKFKALPWFVTVAQSGTYRVTLYRHDVPANKPIQASHAMLEVDGRRSSQAIMEAATYSSFELPLQAGDVELKAWFADGEDGREVRPSFYVYIERL